MYQNILTEDYPLTEAQISFYKKNAFIKLKYVLPPEILEYYGSLISDKVKELKRVNVALEDRNTYGKAFLQLANLWRVDEEIKQFVFSRKLAKIASDLMETAGVRMYHDQALFKEAGGGITPWHADQYYWPLSTDKTITAWIPLQAVPLNMGPLEFSAGSHKLISGRELSISDESEIRIKDKLRVNDFEYVVEPYDIGEISFHSGWIFHRAGANITETIRKVMTVIYMDKEMTLKEPENKEQILDLETWCPGAKAGEIIDSPLNPVLFN
ncbi:MAG: phytanoyl-CoA dioxygenase [Ignavibacteriae bacterium HGW-Ignavibacteriae-3]|nr:MAG: phytanoyl-CoA dioxygenase [Ignavibacteriae bacterium HGW-Ignavibacteriae-3]